MANKKNQRVNFASVKSPLAYPDFLEVQLKSFKDFLQLDTPPELRKYDGLYKVFSENFPINDTRNNFNLEFLDYFIDPPRFTIEECLERDLTYSVPLKAKLKLSCDDPDHEDFDTVVQDVFLGFIPYMTDRSSSTVPSALWFRNYTVHPVYSSAAVCMPTALCSILPVSSPSRAVGSSSRQTLIM